MPQPTHEVSVTRDVDGTIGIDLGSTDAGLPCVASVRAGSASAQTGKVHAGDIIVAVRLPMVMFCSRVI